MVEALLKMTEMFRRHRIDYCLIGGLAMMLHHGRANTVDIDFYVLVKNLTEVLDLFQQERVTAERRGDFQLKAKIGNVPVDILFADHYIGAEVVLRAVEKKLGDRWVRVATPEDLIILKTLADRSIDRRDVEELRELFGKKLDEEYITRKLKRLKEQLEE